MSGAAPSLRMAHVSKSFPGVRALDDVTFEARSGEVVGLIGVNGAGKSTLMNILGGIVQADSGTISIDGVPATIRSPTDAEGAGIAFIHQELLFFDSLSVAENLFVAHPVRHRLVPFLLDRNATIARARQVLEGLGADLTATAAMETLSVGQKQIVEIARAVASGAGIVIFDEPSSSLSVREKAELFRLIGRLRDEGRTIVYISHFLDEIIDLCDRYVVLRNGRLAGHGLVADTTKAALIRMIVGGELAAAEPVARGRRDRPALVVEGVQVGNLLRDVSFHIGRGEVLGLWGLMGSGRTELVRALTGLDPMDVGSVRIAEGDSLEPISPARLLQLCGYVTESRRTDGLFLDEPVWKNITATRLAAFTRGPLRFLDRQAEQANARQHIDAMQIRTPGESARVANLSGGNQQKAIFAKWLDKRPPVLLLDEPTRGVDVSAKLEIGRLITRLAGEGAACLLISSEIEEIVALCDRVLVLRGGRIVREVEGEAIDETALMAMALGEEHLHG